jgi:hypothetical protein
LCKSLFPEFCSRSSTHSIWGEKPKYRNRFGN